MEIGDGRGKWKWEGGRHLARQVVDGDSVALVIKGKGVLSTRSIALADVVKAVVQVEFSRPTAEEMDLAGGVVGGRPSPANTDEIVNVEAPEEGSDK